LILTAALKNARMTKNILEWGWHTSTPNSSYSSNTDWQPPTTLLGGADPHTPPAEPDQKIAAWGDRKCQGACSQGGSRGTTGMYEITNRYLCHECAIKATGSQGLPAEEQIRTLEPYLLKPK
jgi:hypothetical protein